MSKIEVNQVDPQSGTTLTLGTSGDTVSIPSGVTLANAGTVTGIPTSALSGTIATAQIADDAVTLAKMAPGTDGNLITYDASGNPVAVATGSSGQVLTSAGAGAVPSFADAGGGAYNLLSTTTISSQVASVSITSNIDSTYRDYMFIFSDIHTSADDRVIQANVYSSNGSPDVGSNSYNCAGIGYRSDNAGLNQASASAGYSQISLWGQGNANAEAGSLVLYMFNPSGTTHNKSFMSTSIAQTIDGRTAVGTNGFLYRNGTVAVTGMRFLPSSGYFHSGVIKLYGIS